jgi:hypothetical protein
LTPVVGSSEAASVTSGSILIKRPGARTFTRLTGAELIPNGSQIDATNGHVTLMVASGTPGVTHSVELWGGRFILDQTAGTKPRTTFTLSLPLTGCVPVVGAARAAAAARHAKKPTKPRKRHVWASDHGGQFDTRGQYVSTSVQGTTWVTADTCTTSTVKVAQGVVIVHDIPRRRTVTLHTGQSYTARKSR